MLTVAEIQSRVERELGYTSPAPAPAYEEPAFVQPSSRYEESVRRVNELYDQIIASLGRS